MTETIDEKRRQRLVFMRHLYESTGGSELQPISIASAAEQLGWDSERVEGVVEYLHGEGLIDFQMGNNACITHAGVVEVEAAESHPDQPTAHFPPTNIVYVGGDIVGSQVQAGAVGSSQVLRVEVEREQIVELVTAFRRAISDPEFPSEARLEAEAYLGSVESQMKLQSPNAVIVREGISTLRAIAENLAASGMFVGLVELARLIHL